MLLSPFAAYTIAEDRRHDLAREARAQRALRIAYRTVVPRCPTDATAPGTVDAAGARRLLHPRAWFARRTVAKAGA